MKQIILTNNKQVVKFFRTRNFELLLRPIISKQEILNFLMQVADVSKTKDVVIYSNNIGTDVVSDVVSYISNFIVENDAVLKCVDTNNDSVDCISELQLDTLNKSSLDCCIKVSRSKLKFN